jgi:hypothetical protein
MESCADSVADEIAYDAESSRFHHSLDCGTDVAEMISRLCHGYARVERITRDLQQLP